MKTLHASELKLNVLGGLTWPGAGLEPDSRRDACKDRFEIVAVHSHGAALRDGLLSRAGCMTGEISQNQNAQGRGFVATPGSRSRRRPEIHLELEFWVGRVTWHVVAPVSLCRGQGKGNAGTITYLSFSHPVATLINTLLHRLCENSKKPFGTSKKWSPNSSPRNKNAPYRICGSRFLGSRAIARVFAQSVYLGVRNVFAQIRRALSFIMASNDFTLMPTFLSHAGMS
jgi:hypothetical protein